MTENIILTVMLIAVFILELKQIKQYNNETND